MEKGSGPVAVKRRPVALPVVMILCLAVPAIAWMSALEPALPRSVYLYDLARLMALFGFVLLFFQYVLSGKIGWIERRTGAAPLIRFHRRLGLIAFILILSHPSLLLLSERLQGYTAPMHPIRVLGAFTLLVICVAAIPALLSRQLHLKYRTWKKVHRLAYVVFPLAFVHSIIIGATLQKGTLKVFWLALGAGYLLIVLHKVLRQPAAKLHP